jgi:hypothetical protein
MPFSDSAKARGSVQSLNTPRAYTICIEVCFYDFVFWMLQKFLQSCCGVETEKNLLIPKPELSSLQVSFERPFRFPSVTIALREVKLVSRNEERISFDQECSLKYSRIVGIFVLVPATCAIFNLLNK